MATNGLEPPETAQQNSISPVPTGYRPCCLRHGVRQQVNWTEPVPFDRPASGRVLGELDADRLRIAEIRRENVRHSALRYDWLYRIRAVFHTLGLTSTEAMDARAARLRAIAEACDGSLRQLRPSVAQ